MGISVWCAEEEIARQWLALGVITLITLRGRDYKFMRVWVLHVYRRRCRMSLSRHAGNFHRSGQCHAVSLSSVWVVFFFPRRDVSVREAKHRRRRQRRKGGGGRSLNTDAIGEQCDHGFEKGGYKAATTGDPA